MKKTMKSALSMLLTLVMMLAIAQTGVFAAENEPLTISADSKTACPGSTIDVEITLKNNPGVSSIGMDVSYDKKILSLEKVTYNTEMGGITQSSKLTENPVKLLWVNSNSDYSGDAVFATLTYKVNENASNNASSDIELSVDEDNIYNLNETNVKSRTVNGKVSVQTVIAGDINNDSKVNNKDVSRLMQYLANWHVEVNTSVIDCNGDSKVNNKDVSRLMQYLANWDVELHPTAGENTNADSHNECEHKLTKTDAVAPTCEKDGKKAYYVCSVCGKCFSDVLGTNEVTESELVIPKTGHTAVTDPAVAPTADSEGKTEGSHCAVCGEVIQKQEAVPRLTGKTYPITYHLFADDDYLMSKGINNTNEAYYDSEKGLTLENLSVDGYIFEGWYDGEGADSERVKNIPAGSTGKKDLYAKWTPREYKITFDSPLVPVQPMTYKVNTGATLHNPSLSGYNFIGWCDKSNNLVTEIPVGTTGNIKLYANWTSKRNQTRPVSHLDDPLILEDSNKGEIMFAYEIGTIENVPIKALSNTYQSVGGMKQTYTTSESATVTKSEAQNIAKTVSNTTSDSKAWSLSENWNDVTSVSSSYASQKGWTKEEAEQKSKTSSNTYSMNSSSGGSMTNTSSSGLSGTLSTSNSNTAGGSYTSERERGSEYSISDKSSVNAEAGASIGVEGFGSASTKMSAGYELSESEKNYEKNKSSANINYSNTGTSGQSITGQCSSASSGTSSWNSSSGYSSSTSVSQTQSVRNVLSEVISETKNYGSSYSKGGSKNDTQSFTNTAAESDQYSNAITFSEGTTKTETKSIELGGENEGYYRFVLAGIAHVFAVVGYDVSTSSYYVFTYTVMDDKTYTFVDYSKHTASFNDNENGVLPFEVPYFVKQYVDARITQTAGLSVSQEGVITSYRGADDIVFVPSYYKMDNLDGTYTSIKITGIDKSAFAGKNIKAVSLSNFITEIPGGAFKDCGNLQAILCPGVDKIQSYAFKGCGSLRDFNVPKTITKLGSRTFDGVTKLSVDASNKEVALGAIDSGAKEIVLSISDEPDKMNNSEFVVPDSIDYFELRGNAKSYDSIKIKSDAKSTIINGLNITNNSGITFDTSSENVVLNRLSIESKGISALFRNDKTDIKLYGSVKMKSDNGKTIVSRNFNLSEVDASIASSMSVDGNILICGKIGGQNLLKISNGSVITITDEEFEKYVKGCYEVSFDANGGNVTTKSKAVYYGCEYGELPAPTRDYHKFDGWYTAANGGEKVTANSKLSSTTDTTLYAHWTENETSDWVPASQLPEGAKVKSEKWTYDLVTKKTSSSKTMDGYTLYDTSWKWSDYGAWSGETQTAVTKSESRDVSSRYVQPTYKTQYNYSRWAQYSNNTGRLGPVKGTWSNIYCQYYFEKGWSDSALGVCGSQYSNQVGGYFNIYGDNYGGAWYNQTTRQVQTGGGYTLYKYRDRSKIYTYYFQKSEPKESETEVKESVNNNAPSESITNVQRLVKYINK